MENLKILRVDDMKRLLGISQPTLWRLENNGELPPKIKISKRCVGWLESDVMEYIQSRKIGSQEEN